MSRSIEQTYDIKASPEEVWRALTDPKEIKEWSGANAYFVPQPGAMYTLWNGDITGKVLKAEPNALLSQTWQPKDWKRTDSVVTFMLGHSKEGTKVVLLHENVEEDDYDGTNDGWDEYYLGAIKKMLEARTRVIARKKPAAKKQTTKAKSVSAKKKSKK
jgi:uncharacterized protein YndB with AHSA1/START domain